MSTLIAITYDTADKAPQALEKLGELQKMQLVTLEDAAVVVKDQKGKVKVTQTLEKMNTGSAALFGGFWGLLIGLLFLAPIFWGLFGALMGALFSKGTDLGIDNKFIDDVGDSLDPGESALFILVVEATTDKVLPEMAKPWSWKPPLTKFCLRWLSLAAPSTRPPSPTRMRRLSSKRLSTKMSARQQKLPCMRI
jgi:uncharacterized membrane protein